MFTDEIDAVAFLHGLPTGLTTDVARACGEMAFTRKDALAAFLKH